MKKIEEYHSFSFEVCSVIYKTLTCKMLWGEPKAETTHDINGMCSHSQIMDCSPAGPSVRGIL